MILKPSKSFFSPAPRQRSDELRALSEERYWLEERAYYAMALDREKRPLRVDSSNPGHLLFLLRSQVSVRGRLPIA